MNKDQQPIPALPQQTSFFSGVFDEDIEVTYVPTGEKKKFAIGTSVSDTLPKDCVAIAALCNNECLSLSEKLDINSTVDPIPFDGSTALDIYTESLCFLMGMASHKRFPGQTLKTVAAFEHSIFFRFEDMHATSADINLLRNELRAIVDGDHSIARTRLSFEQALCLFKKRYQSGSYHLIKSTNQPYVSVALCNGHADLWKDTLVHRTGILDCWKIESWRDGILLRHPAIHDFTRLGTSEPLVRMADVMEDYARWGEQLDVPNVAALNKLTSDRKSLKDFIAVSEYLHEKRISEMASSISKDIRAIFIAGPSSSGKTTMSNRLLTHLKCTGAFHPVRVSLDDFYRTATEAPRDQDGVSPDFEHLEALNTERLSQCLTDLAEGRETRLLSYSFTSQVSSEGPLYRLPEGGVMIIEGIHALNDKITSAIPEHQRLKIFIRPIGSLRWDTLRIIRPRDTRLIRRIVRDSIFRGCPAAKTIKMWPSVRRGEAKWILPGQTNCDIYYNSSVLYELFTLRVVAVPLLKNVGIGDGSYKEARRLLRLLSPLLPIPPDLVPDISLLCEFLPGGSKFNE
eukprot:gnl/Dysnectes_brevis/2073_a2399_1589.p1 GENE.gnl/Dysnectes_brevis/2073_a2399_1589~~gnl/Dysnectes_brevis/2073_a2399_1589.p1  ORF type:complete len:585 (-),score=209.91 gnl/Dysnectes_brevis/2073_a2399_1589:44-1753(-)